MTSSELFEGPETTLSIKLKQICKYARRVSSMHVKYMCAKYVIHVCKYVSSYGNALNWSRHWSIYRGLGLLWKYCWLIFWISSEVLVDSRTSSGNIKSCVVLTVLCLDLLVWCSQDSSSGYPRNNILFTETIRITLLVYRTTNILCELVSGHLTLKNVLHSFKLSYPDSSLIFWAAMI